MRKTDLAYTAGIIDGEGCIGIYKHPSQSSKDKIRYTLTITVAMTNEWTIQWLRFAYGGSVKSQQRPLRKRVWIWTVEAQQALVFLKLISPYLHLKHPQAELAIKFQENKKRQPGSNHLLEEAQSIIMKGMKHNAII